ncbi:MAG TPA: hypothetical protein DCS93_11855 [Microscillaceae bacterium]|nr:hypothetical protein [Microscillaceae bacterium]
MPQKNNNVLFLLIIFILLSLLLATFNSYITKKASHSQRDTLKKENQQVQVPISKAQIAKIYHQYNNLYLEIISMAYEAKMSKAQQMSHYSEIDTVLTKTRLKLKNTSITSAGGALRAAAYCLYLMHINMPSSMSSFADEKDFIHFQEEFRKWMEITKQHLDRKIKK